MAPGSTDATALLQVTRQCLLDAIEHGDPALALRQLNASLARTLQCPCRLRAVSPQGDLRWQFTDAAQHVPDQPEPPHNFSSTGSRLLGERPAVYQLSDNILTCPLQHAGLTLGSLEIGPLGKLDPEILATQLAPAIESATLLMLRESRRGGDTDDLNPPWPFHDTPILRQAFAWEWDVAHDSFSAGDEGFAQLGYAPPKPGQAQRDWNHLIHPDDLALNREAYLRHARGQTPTYRHVYRARAHDGQWRWVEERGRIVERQPDGRPARVVGIQSLVATPHHQTNPESLILTRLQKIASHVPGTLFQMVWRANGTGYFPYVSQRCEAMVGVSAADLARDATLVLAMISTEQRQPALASLNQSRRNLSTWQIELHLQPPNEPARWLRCAATPQHEPDGSTTWYGYLEDVTAAHALQQSQHDHSVAEAANRSKTEFLSRVSHELRAPLNAMQGFAQLLAMEPSEPLSDNQHRRVTMIRQSGDHLLAMIDDLLDLTSIESGRLQVQAAALDLADVVDDCLAMVQTLAQSHQVALVRCGLASVPMQADPRRLRQVMLNLLTNGIKYNRPGGMVEVLVDAKDGLAWLQVRDSGAGLSAEECSHLFEPFNRLRQAQGKIAGTGIGLSVTRGLVTLMGGHISAHSTLGEGSTFSVSLPLASALPSDHG
jgi:hypothetical protein